MIEMDKAAQQLIKLSESVTYRSMRRVIVPHQRKIARVVARYFRRQGLVLGTLMRDHLVIAPAGYEVLFDRASNETKRDDLTKALELAYLTALLWAAKNYDLELGELTTSSAVVTTYGSVATDTLIAQLDATTRKEIAQIVAKGERVNAALRGLFVSYATQRSEQVGLHQSTVAFNTGNYAAILLGTATGQDFEKSWLSANDDRVTADCIANQDEGWIPFGQAHSSGMQYPPDHVGCRCFEVYRRYRH